MLHKKYTKRALIFLGIFCIFQLTFAQSGDINTEDSVFSPINFEVLREGGITLVLFEPGPDTQNIVEYNIYRRCEDSTWWLVGKVLSSDCGGYACSYGVVDKPLEDVCRYSISSVDNVAWESEKSVEKTASTTYNTVGNTADDVATNDTTDDDNLVVDDTDDETNIVDEPDDVVSVSSTEETNTGSVSVAGLLNLETDDSDELEEGNSITTEDVTRHVAFGKYVIYLHADGAESVEWSIYPDESDTSTYLGRANFNNEKDFWEYTWDTTTTPNGNYVLVPRVISITGQKYQKASTYVRVKNEFIYETSDEERELRDIISEASKEVEKVMSESGDDESIKRELVDTLAPYVKEVEDYIDEKGIEAVTKELEIEEKKAEEKMRTLLNVESSKLLRALDGDEEEFKRFENKVMIAAQKSIENVGYVASEFGIELSDEDLEQLEKEVENQLNELETIIKRRREVLRERVGDDRVFQDSDDDGISNYDEVNIYKTDPFLADSDGDGFFDGAEILGGFNPNNPASEAVLVYEEPRTQGYVEEDIFKVKTVVVSEKEQLENGKEKALKITLAGNAPANSFVTVYIYSMPIIVTVKTDKRGNWIYELDKELEDGNHEVYVAITDNTGSIYAKSKPLPFVKKAAAVTIDQRALFSSHDNSPGFFNGKYLYMVIFLIVALIGWALVYSSSKKGSIV